uniref:Uncharacterized protein n=1 Tax=Arundo donax TaxID=35708 RepID=A0A0A9GJQ7_ARUDO
MIAVAKASNRSCPQQMIARIYKREGFCLLLLFIYLIQFSYNFPSASLLFGCCVLLCMLWPSMLSQKITVLIICG